MLHAALDGVGAAGVQQTVLLLDGGGDGEVVRARAQEGRVLLPERLLEQLQVRLVVAQTRLHSLRVYALANPSFIDLAYCPRSLSQSPESSPRDGRDGPARRQFPRRAARSGGNPGCRANRLRLPAGFPPRRVPPSPAA